MIHQFFDYETIKEGFDSDNPTETVDPSTETLDETPEKDNSKLFKDIVVLIVFYIIFVVIFMINNVKIINILVSLVEK